MSAALFALSTLALHAQNQPTFRSAVELIEVDVRVADGKGNAVRNLRQEDFHLFEDGKEQTIATFAAIDVAREPNAAWTTMAAATRAVPDVSSNERAASDGRMFVILLDDRQIDAQRTPNTIKIVRQFIESNLGDNDLTAVISSSGRTDVSQTFTSNKALLETAVGRFLGRKLPSAAIAAFQQAPANREEAFFEVRSSLAALESVATWMGGIHGRSKSLLLVSEGIDYNYEDVRDPHASDVVQLEREAIDAAARANVAIYPVDPRGLYAFDELVRTGTSGLGSGALGREPAGNAAVDATAAAARRMATDFRNEVNRARSSLRLMAADTGGLAAINTNDFQSTFARIVDQTSSYYVVGYYPANPRREGKFRSIDVRVSGRGLKVTARRGYREAKGDAGAASAGAAPAGMTPSLFEALNSPLPMAGLPLVANAIPFRGMNGKMSVIVVAESASVAAADGPPVAAVDIVTAAVDRHNVVAAAFSRQFDVAEPDEAGRRGLRTITRIDDLQPGVYQIRVAVVAAPSGLRGSLWHDVDVPEIRADRPSMSGLMIVSDDLQTKPTVMQSDVFDGRVATLPTAARAFTRADHLAIYGEIYAITAPERVTVRVFDERGSVMVTPNPASAGLTASAGMHPFLAQLALQGFPPGRYELHVEATVGNTSLERAVPFTVTR